MSSERTAPSELELELKRQDQLFQAACETLAALGDSARLSIPKHVLEELDAAFNAPVLTEARDGHARLHLRA